MNPDNRYTRMVWRFWARVNKNGSFPSDQAVAVHPEILGTRCWEWTGSFFPNGYGQVTRNHVSMGAHRLVWLIMYGVLPDTSVLHKCDNRKCVRPSHLFEGTCKDNAEDKVLKGRSNHAKGAEYKSAKLTEESVRGMRRLRSEGQTLT